MRDFSSLTEGFGGRRFWDCVCFSAFDMRYLDGSGYVRAGSGAGQHHGRKSRSFYYRLSLGGLYSTNGVVYFSWAGTMDYGMYCI